MKNLLLHGAYSGDNFGDTLLLKLLVRELEKYDIEIYLSNVCDKTMLHFSNCDKVKRVSKLQHIINADGLIYGGGGYFSEQPLNKIKWYFRFIKDHILIGLIFALRRKPIGFFAVEFGPIKNNIALKLVRLILNRSKIICARNESSFYWLKSNSKNKNIHHTADLALGIPDLIKYINSNKPKLNAEKFFFLHPSFGACHSDLNKRLVGLLNMLVSQDERFQIYLLIDKDFRGVGEIISSWRKALNLKDGRIIRYSAPYEFCEKISECDYLVSNKLHTLIVASALNKKVISIAKHPKNFSFFDDFGDNSSVIEYKQESIKKLEGFFQQIIQGEFKNLKIDQQINKRLELNYSLLKSFIKSI